MQDRFKFRVYCKSEKKMMLFNNPTLIDGDILQGGLLFKNYDHKITNCHEVLPEDLILLQCTGLKDKNGKLIFDGDLLKDNKGQIGKVFYCTSSASYAVNWKMKDGSYETDDCFGYGEVIGNIYENPELLEEVLSE